MRVLIPAAGFGTGLHPLTITTPKPLINVAGKPMLGHILDNLHELKKERLMIVHGYLGDQIQSFVQNYETTVQVNYYKQEKQLGQAHAIWMCANDVEGPLLVIFADTIFFANLNEDIENLPSEFDGFLYVKTVDDPRRFGIVQMDGEFIKNIIEKPSEIFRSQAITGIYYFRNSSLLLTAIEFMMKNNIVTKGEYYLTDALQIMIDRGAKLTVRELPLWLDCGKPEALLETNRILLDRIDGKNEDNIVRGNNLIIQPSYVSSSAILKNSIIGPYAVINEDVCIRNSIIRDSIINSSSIIENVFLEKTIIGESAQVIGESKKLLLSNKSKLSI